MSVTDGRLPSTCTVKQIAVCFVIFQPSQWSSSFYSRVIVERSLFELDSSRICVVIKPVTYDRFDIERIEALAEHKERAQKEMLKKKEQQERLSNVGRGSTWKEGKRQQVAFKVE